MWLEAIIPLVFCSLISTDAHALTYTVVNGDVAGNIAEHFGVSLRALREKNADNLEKIRPGQKIEIPLEPESRYAEERAKREKWEARARDARSLLGDYRGIRAEYNKLKLQFDAISREAKSRESDDYQSRFWMIFLAIMAVLAFILAFREYLRNNAMEVSLTEKKRENEILRSNIFKDVVHLPDEDLTKAMELVREVKKIKYHETIELFQIYIRNQRKLRLQEAQ